jgi:site-specific recombinase XerD
VLDPGLQGAAGTPEVLEAARQELRLRGYSRRTRKAYLQHMRHYLDHVGGAPEKVAGDEVRRYLLHRLEEDGISRPYYNQALSAIQFLYQHVLGVPQVVVDLPRPRREQRLPVVLSRGEVRALFAAITNDKHRALLFVIYSGGFRVGEAVRLRMEDLDEERRLVHGTDRRVIC